MDSHAQLQSMLQNNLSAEHALFFAEPVQDAEGKQVDWYSHAYQPPVRLDSLPPQQQFAARDAIERLARDVDAFAESLKKDGQGGKFIRGSILSLALQYPGEEFIYMSGSQPVLTAWGCRPATMGTQPESLTRFSETASPPPPPPPYFAETPAANEPPQYSSSLLGPVLGFLIGLAMLVGVYFLATLVFGVSGCSQDTADELVGCSAKVSSLPGCSMPFGSDQEKTSNATAPLPGKNATTGIVTLMTAEKEKEESLRRQLENLRAEISARSGECPRSIPPQAARPKPEEEAPVTPQETPPAPEEEQGPPSLAELMPLTPAEPPKEDPPVAKPPKKTPPKPKSSDLVIPEGAIENNDLSFLEGCWNNATMLRDGGTNKPIRSTYCFDKNGRGTRTERGIGHDLRCKGSANARFSGNKLRITATEARCTSSSRGSFNYPKEAIICERTRDGKANCYESQNDRWKAKLQRVK